MIALAKKAFAEKRTTNQCYRHKIQEALPGGIHMVFYFTDVKHGL